MIEYHIDLSGFPRLLHRIVKSWYSWQEIYLRTMGNFPSEDGSTQEGIQHHLNRATRPPTMTDATDFRFIDDYEISYYLVIHGDEYYIDKQSRGSRNRYWMFRRFEDAEKYMLFLISQNARPGKYSDSPSFRWYQEGLDPRVTLTKPDPINYPGRVSMTVDHELTDRGWMPEHDAIAASHLIALSFDELDEVLRQGIPRDWFTLNIATE